MKLIWMVIMITVEWVSGRGHYLKSRGLNRAVKIRGIALPMNSLSRCIALPIMEDFNEEGASGFLGHFPFGGSRPNQPDHNEMRE